MTWTMCYIFLFYVCFCSKCGAHLYHYGNQININILFINYAAKNVMTKLIFDVLVNATEYTTVNAMGKTCSNGSFGTHKH